MESDEFYSTHFRYGKAARFGLIIALCGLLLYSMSHYVTSVVIVYMGLVSALIAFFGYGFVRSFRAGIRLTDEGVETRTTYATKLWRWEGLERARALDHETRGGPFFMGAAIPAHLSGTAHREPRMQIVPMLYLTNGRDYRLYGLRIVTASVDESAWIDDAVVEINRRIEARKAGGAPTTPTPS